MDILYRATVNILTVIYCFAIYCYLNEKSNWVSSSNFDKFVSTILKCAQTVIEMFIT